MNLSSLCHKIRQNKTPEKNNIQIQQQMYKMTALLCLINADYWNMFSECTVLKTNLSSHMKWSWPLSSC